MGLLFGVTGVIDKYHTVIASLGDRWLLRRMAPVKGQLATAIKHRGAATKTMRAELAEAVAKLFAAGSATPQDITAAIDLERLEEVIQVTLAKAKGGDVPSGHLLRTLLERKAGMLGYDAPMKIDPVLVLDAGKPHKTSTDRIAEVIERLCAEGDQSAAILSRAELRKPPGFLRVSTLPKRLQIA